MKRSLGWLSMPHKLVWPLVCFRLTMTWSILEHLVCYISRKLRVHEKNYSTIEKEALALLTAVWACSVYFGSSPVFVYTDHSPLQFLETMANHNQKLLRWKLELQQFNFGFRHRPGRANFLPDFLSRPG